MNTSLKVLRTAILLVVFALPAFAAADDKHDKWIDVLSIDWGAHKPGSSTSMDDGNYKDKQGRYVIVRNGKVESRGWDYTKKEPIKARSNKPRDVQQVQTQLNKKPKPTVRVGPKPQKGVEPDEIDLSTRARKPGAGMTRDNAGALLRGTGRDEIERGQEPQEGIEPDEIDNR